MATRDMEKLVIGSNTYTIADAQARSEISSKQDTLVSGTNIKTINGSSLLGSGDIEVSSGTDYIVATGSQMSSQGNGVWYYRRWNSGTKECWGEFSMSVTEWASWGQMFYSKPYLRITYPSEMGSFTNYPQLFYSAHYAGSSGGDIFSVGAISGASSKTQTPQLFLTRPTAGPTTSGSTTPFYAHIYVIGE